MTTVPAPLEAQGSSTVPGRRLSVGIVGLGRAGLVHAALAGSIPNVEVTGLVDRRSEARRNARGVGFKAPTFDRLDRMILKTDPNAILVCLPAPERERMVRIALEAGVPVLSEAPLARTLADAEALAALAREKNAALALMHGLTFHPVFTRALDALASSALGAPRRVRCAVYRSRVFQPERQREVAPPESGGGVLVHEALDALILLLGAFGMPREVKATMARLYGPQEDEMHATLRTAAGLEIGIDASWSVPGYLQTATVLEVDGDQGRLLASDDALELDLTEGRGEWRPGHTRLALGDLPQIARFTIGGETPYLMDAAFLAWIGGAAAAPPHAIEPALQVQRVMEALYASAAADGATIVVTA
jgi:UDP-N-acetyl-2-amino-2-deoxyglucuronate dehydrogenase